VCIRNIVESTVHYVSKNMPNIFDTFGDAHWAELIRPIMLSYTLGLVCNGRSIRRP